MDNIYGETLEIIAQFKNKNAEEFGFKVRQFDKEEIIVAYNSVKKHVFIDREKAGRS